VGRGYRKGKARRDRMREGYEGSAFRDRLEITISWSVFICTTEEPQTATESAHRTLSVRNRKERDGV
jgi:hypothetical protein